jgi:hypothetical protein
MVAGILSGPSQLMEINAFLPVNANTSWLYNASGLFLLITTNQTGFLLTNDKSGWLVDGTSSKYWSRLKK